jgi:hypothetical protein
MTKKFLKFMLEERRFVTEAGKLTTEARKNELETCAQMGWSKKSQIKE